MRSRVLASLICAAVVGVMWAPAAAGAVEVNIPLRAGGYDTTPGNAHTSYLMGFVTYQWQDYYYSDTIYGSRNSLPAGYGNYAPTTFAELLDYDPTADAMVLGVLSKNAFQESQTRKSGMTDADWNKVSSKWDNAYLLFEVAGGTDIIKNGFDGMSVGDYFEHTKYGSSPTPEEKDASVPMPHSPSLAYVSGRMETIVLAEKNTNTDRWDLVAISAVAVGVPGSSKHTYSNVVRNELSSVTTATLETYDWEYANGTAAFGIPGGGTIFSATGRSQVQSQLYSGGRVLTGDEVGVLKSMMRTVGYDEFENGNAAPSLGETESIDATDTASVTKDSLQSWLRGYYDRLRGLLAPMGDLFAPLKWVSEWE